VRPWIPTHVAATLANYAIPVPAGKRGRILDATCFEGAALRLLGKQWNCDTYGVEPTSAAIGASYGATRVVQDDLRSVRVAKGSMSAVMGVLPHGGSNLSQRDHSVFVLRLLEALAPGGMAVVLGPVGAFDKGLCTTLTHRLDPMDVFALPLIDGAVIAVGLGVSAPRRGGMPGRLAACIAEGRLPPFQDLPAPLGPLPVPDGEFYFGPRFPSYAELAEMAREHGVWEAPAFAEELAALPPRPLRPLMPLRRGHLALLIAAGMFDNLIVQRDGRRIALKGRTYKEPQTAVDDGCQRVRYRFRTTVSALDLTTGDLSLLQDT
jgi:hypothetical protein